MAKELTYGDGDGGEVRMGGSGGEKMRECVESHVFGRGVNEFANKRASGGRGVADGGVGGSSEGGKETMPLFAQRTETER